MAESYLLRVELSGEYAEDKLHVQLQQAGMTLVKKEDTGGYKNYQYELSSDSGTTRVSFMLSPAKPNIKELSVRFPVPAPPGIIDQTFGFLGKLNALLSIAVYDTEIRTHIFSQYKKQEENILKYQRLIEENKAEIDRQCYIPVDAQAFKRNEIGLEKRRKVLEAA
jgi:hypothetical protein